MQCTQCHFDNPAGMKFCGSCGSPLQAGCPNCGFENPPGFKFCGNCGHQQQDQEPQSSRVEDKKSEGERRRLTVMFCDVVGSTALSEKLDAEDLRSIVTDYQAVCEKVVARYEGHIAQYLGDGIMVYFGYPAAHENDAHRAVSSGLGIIDAVARLNERLEVSKGIRIAVRLGVHTGTTVIGDIGSAGQSQQLALGATPNIAARMEGLAEPNTMVISSDTHTLVHKFFAFEDLGERHIKGISEAIKVFRVLRENIARSRFEATGRVPDRLPLVGRDREVEKLVGLWEAAKSGSSHVVLLSGEAGVGKSRIMDAIAEHVADDNGWLVPHECSPYHRHTAFYPFVRSIRSFMKLMGDEPFDEQILRLEEFLQPFGLPLTETLPLFAHIMSISLDGSAYQLTQFSHEQQRQKIADAFLTMFLIKGSEQPMLLIFEDLHWIDPASLNVITKLIQRAPTIKTLALFSFRPAFEPPWPMRAHIMPMTLSRLAGDAVEEIITKIANSKKLPAALVDQIVQKTDGVPLFVEELTRMVLDSDLVRELEDRYELTGQLDSLAIPSTLHDSLVARLDRMSHTKEIAQIASVIGREFQYSLIRAAANMEESALRVCLDQLVDAQLMTETGVGNDTSYSFRHALIRDAAYQSLLKSQRQKLHAQLAEILKNDFPEIIKLNPEKAAYHFEKGGISDQAIRYWTQAGENGSRREAFDEALKHLEHGTQLLTDIEDASERDNLELGLVAVKAPVFQATTGWAATSVYDTADRMRTLAIAQGDTGRLFNALNLLSANVLFAGKVDEALRLAKEMLTLAEQAGFTDKMVEANRAIGISSVYSGDLRGGLEAFEQAIAILTDACVERSRDTGFQEHSAHATLDSATLVRAQSSHLFWYLGYPDRALARIMEALALSVQTGRGYDRALCNFIASLVCLLRGEYKKCLEYTTSGIEIGTKYGIKHFAMAAHIVDSCLKVRNGQIEQGLSLMHENVEGLSRISQFIGTNIWYASMADACLSAGELLHAKNVLQKAQEMRQRIGDQLFISEIPRLQGELALAENEDGCERVAEQYFQESLQIAKKQDAKSFELRTTMSLVRLWNNQGKGEKGQEMLSELYNWFTEGFETQDLIEAGELLKAHS